MKLKRQRSTLSQRIIGPFQWLFMRLPRPFSIPLVVVAFFYFFLLFPVAVNFGNSVIIRAQEKVTGVDSKATFVSQYLKIILNSDLGWATLMSVIYVLVVVVALIASALMTLALALIGILLSYWLAAHFYMLYRRLTVNKMDPPVPVSPRSDRTENHTDNPLAGFKRIGIILSGGGAKGAYQAGAMKAIYEFLEEHDAHRNVQMIGATSIGSWNALFWLADLIKPQNGGAGPLEQWWSQVTMQKIILPITYVPTRQNYLLSNQPWRDDFDALFKGTLAGERLVDHAQRPEAEESLRFYFTHCNIGKANLAFTTNRQNWESVTANLPNRRSRPVVAPGSYRVVEDTTELGTLRNIRRGVFCSMDIPPLFPYTPIDEDFFEDGGVIDNLPIRFGTEVEDCDLLFILPLNASFERKVDQRSLIRRLARVTEIRQGVLERNSFKILSLQRTGESQGRLSEFEGKDTGPLGQAPTRSQTKARSEVKIADRALARKHNVVHVFSICPAPELKIGTTEFWKTKEAGEAFRFMYEVTKNELKRFTHLVSSNQIRMALVSPAKAGSENGQEAAVVEPTPDEESYFDNAKPILKQTDSLSYYVTYFRDF